jgi:hypothetical protein
MITCEWSHANDRSVMGSFRNLGLVGWRAAPAVDDIRRWRSLGHALEQAHPGGSACIDLVVGGTPRFSDEMRKEAEQFASDPRAFSLGIAHLIVLPGFAGTAVRAFISTIILVARPPSPAKAFGDAESACSWLLARLRTGSVASGGAPAASWTEAEVMMAQRALMAKLGS